MSQFDRNKMNFNTIVIFLAGFVGLSAAVCPPMWTQFNKQCYRYYGTPFLNWVRAEAHCVKEGAHLVSIHSQEEFDFVLQYWRSTRDNYHMMDMYPFTTDKSRKPFLYIGLSDLLINGVFQWTDGTRVDFLNWMPNNPSLNSPEEGVMIWDRGIHPSRGGIWNDVAADSKVLVGAFMCKKSPGA